MASNFSPWSLVGSGIGGAFQYAGAKKQAEAETQASQLQYQSTQQALADARAQRAYQQQQYGQYLNRLQPYSQMGTSAGQSLGQLIARSPYAQYAATGQAPVPEQFTLPQSSIGALAPKS